MAQHNVIILNFMFAGEYLDDNIGHEIINLYTSDSGKKYVYLCPDGKIDTKLHPVDKIEHIVFARRTETANQIEILGFTEGPLIHIPTDDKRQYDVIYGGKPIGDIFSNNNKQQTVNITFEASRGETGAEYPANGKGANVYRVTESFNISINDFKEYRKSDVNEDSKIFKIKTSLRGYIDSDNNKADYSCLKSKLREIKQRNIYKEIEKLNTNIDTTLTMAEVYGIINRELPYSDAMKFFIDKYSEEFKPFFIKLSSNKIKDPGKYIRTLREWRNIDLIVEYENAVFIIENKIFSKINGIKLTEGEKVTDQLDKYKSIIVDDDENKESFQKNKNRVFILLYPDHNPIQHSHQDWANHKYSELDDALKEIIAKNDDPYLEDFERAVAYHRDPDYNYTIMNKRFVKALKNRIHIKQNALKSY